MRSRRETSEGAAYVPPPRNSRVDEVRPVSRELEPEPQVYNPSPLSSGGMSAGADDPTVGILDLTPSSFNSAAPAQNFDLENIFGGESNIQSFNSIQN